MEIAYTLIRQTSREWIDLCVWLDTNCPGWKLAHYHSKYIKSVRDGSVAPGIARLTRLIKTTKEQAVKIKLFHDDVETIWSGEALPDEVCIEACELAEYSGYWKEMPVELMSEATIEMAKDRVIRRQAVG